MIESRATRRFWRLFSALPADVQEDAREAYKRFRTNPNHPSLHFKKLEGEGNIYSVRIGLNYRAVAAVGGNRAVWYWIGDHDGYDRLT